MVSSIGCLTRKFFVLTWSNFCKNKNNLISSYFKNSKLSLIFNEITMASNRYCVEVAKRGAAGCKNCKSKIDKGIVRIAKIVPNPFTDSGGDMKQWFHVRCIFEKLSRARATTKKIDSTDDLEGWDELDEDSKEEVLTVMSEFSIQSGSKTTTKKTPSKEQENKSEPPANPGPSNVSTVDNSFRTFRKICAKIADEPRYTEKTAIFSEFFKKGSDGKSFKGDLYLWIKLLLPGVNKRVYNLQNKQIVKLFSEIFSVDQETLLEDLEQGDVAETIRMAFENSKKCPPRKKSDLTLHEIDKFLDDLTKVSREVEQSNILLKVAKKCTSNDLKMFIRFIKHDLRINTGPKHILEAIHPDAYKAFQASQNLEDIVQLSSGRKTSISVQASLMTPIKPMLAQPCRSVDGAFAKCPNGLFAEIKYDGERVQLHKRGNEFSYFSRSLKPVMPHKVVHLKDYIPRAFPHGNNLILDSEILLVDKDGKILPFGTLGAHKKIAFKDASVCLFVFDCLHFNDESLIEKPLTERRKILKENMKPIKNHVMFSEMKSVKDQDELRGMIKSFINQGLEGLMIKDKKSIYEPGKRHWLKMKKDYLKDEAMADSADLVVLGAYYGTGKRGGIMSIFLMGCYDDRTRKWCTVTKVSGQDDATVDRLQDELDMVKIKKDMSDIPSWLNVKKPLIPDFVSANPKKSPVWEITGAEFSKAEIHTAQGISIRFPRVTRIRDDKSWEEATSLSELKKLYEASKEKSDLVGLKGVGDDDDDDDDDDNDDENDDNSDDDDDLDSSDEDEGTSFKKGKGTSSKKQTSKASPRKESSKAKRRAMSPDSDVETKKARSNEPSQDNTPKMNKNGTFGNSALPDLFSGLKAIIPSSVEDAPLLRRYFVAYDGVLLKDHEKAEADVVIFPRGAEEEQEVGRESINSTAVTSEWLWDCIKLQKRLSVDLYKS